jgi:hypothetical protein
MDIISPNTVATTTLSTDNTDLIQSIRDLPHQVANLLSEQNLTSSNKGRVNFKDRALVPDLAIPTHPHEILDVSPS